MKNRLSRLNLQIPSFFPFLPRKRFSFRMRLTDCEKLLFFPLKLKPDPLTSHATGQAQGRDTVTERTVNFTAVDCPNKLSPATFSIATAPTSATSVTTGPASSIPTVAPKARV
ncbi:hypothetical protein OJ405_002716 [Salmonella enterica]|nr:hypothetical protein [Salmonella enterica]ELS1746437.1 hypothetical protein [Salmonella enterica]ELW3720600.1 hypothetical protein [Salmonella enterica]EMB7326627.1 hypothetical protein [Salmonella enterica]